MATLKLVGYAHKQGTFTDEKSGRNIEFNNIVLDVISDVPLEGEYIRSQFGFHCSSIKVKYEQFRTIFPADVKQVSDLNQWINKEIKLEYSLIGAKPTLCGIALSR